MYVCTPRFVKYKLITASPTTSLAGHVIVEQTFFIKASACFSHERQSILSGRQDAFCAGARQQSASIEAPVCHANWIAARGYLEPRATWRHVAPHKIITFPHFHYFFIFPHHNCFSSKLIAGTLPPRGFSLFTRFPNQKPGGRRPPSKHLEFFSIAGSTRKKSGAMRVSPRVTVRMGSG